jgi:beta-glucosidase
VRGRAAAAALSLAVLIAPAEGAAPAPAPGSPCAATPATAWCDASRSPDERAGALVRAMTTDEKVAMLAGVAGGAHTGATAAVPRLGVPSSFQTDGPVGVRQGTATAMPAPMAAAATFDPAMAHLYGQTLGAEARAKGNDMLLGPTVNIMRTPLGGRTFEAFGEDPWLVTRMAVADVEGIQSQGVIADVKHLAANNQEGLDPTGLTGIPQSPIGAGIAGSRYIEDSRVDERTLREVYLPAFEAAVKEAHVGAIMCSYNRLNGPWTCASKHLLQDIVRRDWGFDGVIESDWILATHPWGVLDHFDAGLDLEMPFADAYNPLSVNLALASGGRARMAQLDDHVERTLRTLFAFGFFDRAPHRDDPGSMDLDAHAANAQRIAESSMTLLRNDGVLPLDAARDKHIAVIGQYAQRFVTGGGSGKVTPPTTVSVLDGIRARAGDHATVTYDSGADADRAAQLARSSDVAIVVAGDYQTEGADKRCLTLECPPVAGNQDALIESVTAAQPRTVVVLETGGPVLTPWAGAAGAVLEAWYPGERGGAAVARTLYGDVDPAGRLPATFPRDEADLPTAGSLAKYPGIGGRVSYREGVLVGYRWYDAKGLRPAFAFGHGLSYTTFAFGPLKVQRLRGGIVRVSLTVRNTGMRPGVAVPQLYVSLPSPRDGVIQPPRQLRGVRKVALAPGAARRVAFRLDRRALSYWDTRSGDWAVAPGCYALAVGRSSRALVRRGHVPVGGGRCARRAAR